MSQPNDGAGIATLGPVQVVPAGLTGFLQLKQLGRLPGDLSALIRPTIDLRDWFFNSRTLGEVALFGQNTTPTTTTLVTATGPGYTKFAISSVQVVVPQGQMWYVEMLSVSGATGAATDVLSFVPVVLVDGGGLVGVAPPFIDTVTARQRAYLASTTTPFWAGPGHAFGVDVIDISTAGILLSLHMKATVLPL